MAHSPTPYRVTIANTKQVVDCVADQTILEAAIAVGIDYPYACASGNCGTCASHLDAGEVTLLPRGDAALSPQQIKAGQTLACRARPRSDVTITWLSRSRH
jgi:ferredoxin